MELKGQGSALVTRIGDVKITVREQTSAPLETLRIPVADASGKKPSTEQFGISRIARSYSQHHAVSSLLYLNRSNNCILSTSAELVTFWAL